MKKIGKIKKTGLAFTALSVSAALLGGGLVCAMPYHASADNVPSARAATATTVFENLSVPTEADYGDTIKIPDATGATLKVTAPDGADVTSNVVDGYLEANQVGNYTVKYYNGDENAAYSFNVNVSLKEDLFLKVDNNGAGIPTRIKKGDSFDLPSAHVAYYDENKILRYYPGEVTWTVTDSLGVKYDNFGAKVEATNNGKLYLTYSAQIDGGKKFFSEKFTVNVQSADLKDSQAPTLTVSGITSSVSVRRAVTLPTATVSDDYDENPLVEISVTGPDNNPVKVVDIDQYGYAVQKADKLEADKTEEDVSKLNYPEVAFDNKDVMTFYPLVAGQYKVKYVAKDDAGNVSSSKSWTITAGDSVAPVFEEIDDWKIPAKWGVTVKKAGDTEEDKKVDSAIELPIPFLVDNKDHMPGTVEVEEGKEDKDVVSLYVRITDSDYNRDILTFTNVLAKPAAEGENGEKAKADCDASNSVYDDGKTQTFSYFAETPFKFDFANYKRKDKDGEDVDLAGTYTVYYRASDAAGNRSTKQYTIDLKSDYEDTNAPVIEEINLPQYISSADTTFNIPSVIASDAESSTIHTEYKIYSDNGLADEEGKLYITVKGGEKADIVEDEDGKLSLVIDKDKEYEKKLELGDNIYFCVTATDAVGNVTTNLDEASTATEEYAKSKDVVKVINYSASSEYTYNGDAIAFTDSEGTTLTNSEVGSKVIAGGFKIDTKYDLRKYTGFEVSVINAADGSTIETQLETFTAYDETTATIYVKNIQFTPTKAGDHYLTVRVFDVNNYNSVYSYKLEVKAKDDIGSGVKPSAAVVPDGSTGSVNVKYTLKDTEDKFAGAESGKSYYHAYKIRGSVFSLMGKEFTAKAQSSYSVTNGFVEEDTNTTNAYSGYKFLTDGANGGNYSFSVTDSEKPIIEVQGIMPTYAEKNAEVIIPSIIAYSANGAANVEVKVTNAGNPVDVTKVTVDDKETNEYKFVGTKDGVYTIKVTAYRGSNNEASATYTVNIGDVIAPEFSVSGGTTGRKTQGDEFTYGTIKLADENEKNVTITKTIYDPSGAEVSGATVNGSYTSYKDKTNNGSTITLDKSGTYKVVYTVKDSVGNEDPYYEYVTVSATGSSTPTTFTTLSTVLIIIAVVLLAGVIIYVVRFRKVKK